jgi:hypothetical protein
MVCHLARVVIQMIEVMWDSPYLLNRNTKNTVPYWINNYIMKRLTQ